jgi:hypothetical protein
MSKGVEQGYRSSIALLRSRSNSGYSGTGVVQGYKGAEVVQR